MNSPQGNWPAGFTTPPNVLLVDDEANVLNSLRRLLRPAGYEIHTAENGEAALAHLESQAVDLVVSDMRMPGMSGAELLAQVRKRWPTTMRVLLTGYSDITSAVSAINDGGIFRYVSKPWDDAELQTILTQALEIAGLQREKNRLEALTQTQNEELKTLNASLEDKVRQRTEELQIANQEISLTMEKVKKNFFTTVQVLSNLLEMRAPSLAGHGRRVADVAKRLAVKMKLPSDVVNDVLLGGLLHDIGKIGYSDEILKKPFPKMSQDELGIARKHPLNGAAALLSLPDMRAVADIIRCHHERWDGQGYPSNLSGMDIPIGARIVALANDFDSVQVGTLSAKRMTVEEAKTYVLEGRKFRYDPMVVDAFAELIGRVAQPVKAHEERKIDISELKVGMVLARDLYSPEGILLLSVDYVLDELLVKQLREYQDAYGKKLNLSVKA
jgi:response regulator RpfG family c-di-GMP phosphodiesterase